MDLKVEAVVLLAQDLKSLGIQYVFISGVAVYILTSNRPIRDIDLLIKDTQPLEARKKLLKLNPMRYKEKFSGQVFCMTPNSSEESVQVQILTHGFITPPPMTSKNIMTVKFYGVTLNIFHPTVLLVSKIRLFNSRRDGKVGKERHDAKDAIALIEFLKSKVSLKPVSPSVGAIAYKEYPLSP
jgi:hypothetical protein